MSVVTKANYTERKNNVYGEGDVIDFYIPPSNAIINTQDTYMVLNIKLTGKQYKACVSQRAGIYSLFRAVTISAGEIMRTGNTRPLCHLTGTKVQVRVN